MNYILNVDKDGDPSAELWTTEYYFTAVKASDGFNRVVIGGRGPYVEFTDKQIHLKSFTIPKDQLYRFSDKRIYYIEFRSIDDANVKLYYQLKTVSYADYKIGMFYISAYDLYTIDGKPLAKSKVVEETTEHRFFELK
jgi:hypothetical protein